MKLTELNGILKNFKHSMEHNAMQDFQAIENNTILLIEERRNKDAALQKRRFYYSHQLTQWTVKNAIAVVAAN
ncbi:MAG: hypothetical protein MRK00_15250 [Nitrosomonas sp.]|nr:hypothetical protein [Nitrosomonas sp.]